MLSFSRLSQNFAGSVREGQGIILDYPQRLRQKTITGKVLSVSKVCGMVALVPLSMQLTKAGFWSTESILGIAGLLPSFILTRLKNNNHVNVLSAAGTFFLAAQLWMLGAVGLAVFSTTGAVRSTTMAMMPDGDEWQKKRSNIAIGFGLASGAFVCTAAYTVQSLMELVPLVSVVLGTWASSRIRARSHHARVGYVLANMNNMVYGAAYAGSYALAFGAFMNIANFMTTILQEDNLSKGVKSYWRCLKHLHK